MKRSAARGACSSGGQPRRADMLKQAKALRQLAQYRVVVGRCPALRRRGEGVMWRATPSAAPARARRGSVARPYNTALGSCGAPCALSGDCCSPPLGVVWRKGGRARPRLRATRRRATSAVVGPDGPLERPCSIAGAAAHRSAVTNINHRRVGAATVIFFSRAPPL